MIKRILLAAAISLPAVAFAQAPAPEQPFASGEKLSYEVSLLGIQAGEAELRVDQAAAGWRLSASGRTTGATDSFLGLRQSASCEVGDDMLPSICRFISKKRGGERRREVRFDRASGVVRERTLEDGKKTEKERHFDGGLADVQDALSGLYLLRKQLPDDGATVEFRAMRKGKAIKVQATHKGEEVVETDAGTFRTRVVELKILDKVDKDTAKTATAWFTDDARRLPVKISLDAPVGTLDAELVAATGTLGAPVAGR